MGPKFKMLSVFLTCFLSVNAQSAEGRRPAVDSCKISLEGLFVRDLPPNAPNRVIPLLEAKDSPACKDVLPKADAWDRINLAYRIRDRGIEIMRNNGINPDTFVWPADESLKAVLIKKLINVEDFEQALDQAKFDALRGAVIVAALTPLLVMFAKDYMEWGGKSGAALTAGTGTAILGTAYFSVSQLKQKHDELTEAKKELTNMIAGLEGANAQ